MPEILKTPILKISVLGVKDVWAFLNRLEKKDWAAIRKAAGRGMKEAWREAIRRSNINERTGHLRKSVRFRSVGKFEVEMYAYAHYAADLYYGTSPSVGRYVPYMPCIGRGARLVNPWRKRKVKIRTYWQFYDLWSQGRVTELRPGVYKALKEQEKRAPGRPRKGRPAVAYVTEFYDIGIHPGIDARRLGLRRWFEYLMPIYVGVNVIKTLERVTGVKIV